MTNVTANLSFSHGYPETSGKKATFIFAACSTFINNSTHSCKFQKNNSQRKSKTSPCSFGICKPSIKSSRESRPQDRSGLRSIAIRPLLRTPYARVTSSQSHIATYTNATYRRLHLVQSASSHPGRAPCGSRARGRAGPRSIALASPPGAYACRCTRASCRRSGALLAPEHAYFVKFDEMCKRWYSKSRGSCGAPTSVVECFPQRGGT